MKKFIVTCIIALVAISVTFAQVTRRQIPKYKKLKKEYKVSDFNKQGIYAYNPAGLGVASFFVPGLGQFIEGEPGAGGGFLGGYIAGLFIPYVNIAVVIGVPIWSAIHAAKVAKIKNAKWQNMLKDLKAFDIKLRNDLHKLAQSS